MSQSHYFDLAVADARLHASQLEPVTHWIDYDAPVIRGRAEASCGSVVDATTYSQTPTCPACRQQQAIYDTFTF
jgi:hypothetical protein